MGMGRVSEYDRLERLQSTAQAMVRLRSTMQVEKQISQQYGVSYRTVRTWIATVRKQWRAEANVVDREAQRDQMRNDLNTVVQLALNRNIVVKNEDGTVVTDMAPTLANGAPNPNYGKPVLKPNPDLQRALHGMRELINLDGLAQPVAVKVKVETDLESMPDMSKLTDEQMAKAMDLVRSMSPGGDVGALLGDDFKFSGESAPKG